MAGSENLTDRETGPVADEPFWAGLRESRILIQRCDNCGYLRWPPGPLCPECQSSSARWMPVSPGGSLISFARYHRALSPAFADRVPYTVALIELDDGPRMYGNLEGDPSEFKIDQPVRAMFGDGQREMVRWEMAK